MSEDTVDTRALGRLTLLALAFVLATALVSVHASLPSNALHLPLVGSVDVRTLLPQGWGYFSGDARQPLATAYVNDGDGWRQIGPTHQGAPALLFGLDRSGRLMEQEIGVVESAAGTPQDCRAPDRECLTGLRVTGTSVNPLPEPALCGDVAVVRRDPLPWAWSDSADPDRMPATAVRVELSC